jgi:hypothetical protein
MAKLAEQTSGEIATYSLGAPINGIPTVEDYIQEDSGAEMLMVNQDNLQIILGQMFSKASYARSWVEIHDGIGGEEGDLKADGLRRFLHFSKGLPTVYIGPDDHNVTQSRITVYSDEWRPMAEDIARWMGLPKSSIVMGVKPPGVVDLDVIITIGPDYHGPNP